VDVFAEHDGGARPVARQQLAQQLVLLVGKVVVVGQYSVQDDTYPEVD